ncbi:hypothetical protein C7212DRAFT_340792 [Tuber magnatum]|uniref:Uncharacterized protein n=1 Tax=Tuber magnatum TaxID=42249 RepID=A0A317T0I7_9PEZI|nr:hypothetical protein C7212DRAFT_340792 [Tuber magnatum]
MPCGQWALQLLSLSGLRYFAILRGRSGMEGMVLWIERWYYIAAQTLWYNIISLPNLCPSIRPLGAENDVRVMVITIQYVSPVYPPCPPAKLPAPSPGRLIEGFLYCASAACTSFQFDPL